MKPNLDPIPLFMSHFRVIAETSAYHDVSYDKETRTYSYDEPEVEDDTNAVIIYDRRYEENDQGEYQIVLIPGRTEQTVIEEFSELFADMAGDIDAFVDHIKKEY